MLKKATYMSWSEYYSTHRATLSGFPSLLYWSH